MLKECHFSMEGTYTSEGPFLSKMVYIKGYGVGPRGGNSKCKTLFSSSSPQNHAYWSQQILTVWYFFMTGKKEAGSEIFSCLLTSNTKMTGESLWSWLYSVHCRVNSKYSEESRRGGFGVGGTNVTSLSVREKITTIWIKEYSKLY